MSPPCEREERCEPGAALTPPPLCMLPSVVLRFDMMRDSGAKLLLPWMTQGLWCFLLSLPVTFTNALLAADQSQSSVASAVVGSHYNSEAVDRLTVRDVVGWAVWATAFLTEVVADRQKAAFAANEANKGKFIDEGLWSVSRHPNCQAALTSITNTLLSQAHIEAYVFCSII